MLVDNFHIINKWKFNYYINVFIVFFLKSMAVFKVKYINIVYWKWGIEILFQLPKKMNEEKNKLMIYIYIIVKKIKYCFSKFYWVPYKPSILDLIRSSAYAEIIWNSHSEFKTDTRISRNKECCCFSFWEFCFALYSP